MLVPIIHSEKMYKQPTSEPIAVIGSSCRFAGGAISPSKLWEVLSTAPDLSKEVPSSRFNAQAFYHPDGEYHGTTNSVKAYWLDQDHRVFDAGFFNITPKEAEAIDPQQRLVLEAVYEAMESTGYTLPQLSGKDVAVFAGVMNADYDTLSQRDELTTSRYFATGNARSIISNRISYFFNFHGPSVTIDTACSSSLVALHQAVLSLRSGESTLACVTGVNLMLTPENFIVEANLHMLSPTGKSHMWDVDADGYARGEGVAAVFLKPLSAAVADGDQIEGIIRETGVNSDGRTQGITMPNSEAQALLIKSTYRKAGLDPTDPNDRCQYFEAHGTGTQAGDPREAAAIEEAFFGSNEHNIKVEAGARKLLVGSVKTVIGHTEGAAGLAGLLKVLQAMEHGSIPPNLHLKTLNPSVQPFCSNLEIPTTLVPWPEIPVGLPRRASVNSFGFGGTNAHVIVESYTPANHNAAAKRFSCEPQLRGPSNIDQPRTQFRRSDGPSCVPLCLSAASQKSLRAVVSTWRTYLLENPHVDIAALAWHLFSRRTALPYRLAISATSSAHALEQLRLPSESTSDCSEIGIRAKSVRQRPRILGIFTGQGAQWPSMSKSLLLNNSIYRETIEELDHILACCPNPPAWTLKEQILADKAVSRVHDAEVSQPLCTALQIGLVNVLRSLKVEFHTVVGHSSGEIAAVYAAGRLTARDAILISYYRGCFAYLAGASCGPRGGMLAVGTSEDEALDFCCSPTFEGKLWLAANNAPNSVTLSGDLDSIHRAKALFDQQGKFSRVLRVQNAYHSPYMIPFASGYVDALRRCNISPLRDGKCVIWVSSVYGSAGAREDDLSSDYWRDNMVCPVRFYNAVATALSSNNDFDMAIELGPHAALKGPVTQTARLLLGHDIPYTGVLDRRKKDTLAFAEFLGFVWSHLGPSGMDLRNYIQPSLSDTFTGHLKSLPSYPWDHSRLYYRESRLSRQYHFKNATPHELLGVRTSDDNGFELRWRNILKLDTVPWIEHHSFQGQALLPASAYCIMAFEAARQLLDGRFASTIEIRNLNIMNGLCFDSDSAGIEVLFSLAVHLQSADQTASNVIEADFSVTSCPTDIATTMKKNASGLIHISLGNVDVGALPVRCPISSEVLPAEPATFYRMMDDNGLVYSGPFRALQSIERRYKYSSSTLRRRHPEDTTTLDISPATLDSCLQTAFLTYSFPGDKYGRSTIPELNIANQTRSLWTSFLPTQLGCIRFNLSNCIATPNSLDNSSLTVDAYLTDVLPTSRESKATFVVDINISNQRGETEVQVEGLTVTAIARTRPEDDYELYLHTVMNIDPTDEIVQQVPKTPDCPAEYDPMLVESCERVAAYFSRGRSLRMASVVDHSNANINSREWPRDTAATIDDLIASSPYQASLDLIRTLGLERRDTLDVWLPSVVEEAHRSSQFACHLSAIVNQITHRYPRMSILSLTNPEDNLDQQILRGLGSTFMAYTIESGVQYEAFQQSILPKSVQEKIRRMKYDVLLDPSTMPIPAGPYDLVILSTSRFPNYSYDNALKNIRQVMNNDGFLIVIQEPRSQVRDRLCPVTGADSSANDLSTPPQWPEVLEQNGFVPGARNADQSYAPGFSIWVRQALPQYSQFLLNPAALLPSQVVDNVLIIGGIHNDTACICGTLQYRLRAFCGTVSVQSCFDGVSSKTIADCEAAIILADMDQPTISSMSEQRLSQLKELFRPNMTVLWVTRDARSGDPDRAAAFGFLRTIAAEVPNLIVQVLDLDRIEKSDVLIFETFMRLVLPRLDSCNTLSTREPEIHVENGRRLIPRVVPLRQSNNRVNSIRRVVTRPMNTLQSCVEVVPRVEISGSVTYDAESRGPRLQKTNMQSRLNIQVHYSSVAAVNLTPTYSAYVCIGRIMRTGASAVCLSSHNASYVEIASVQACTPSLGSVSELRFVQILIRYLLALGILNRCETRHLALIDPDEVLQSCIEEIAVDRDINVTSFTSKKDGQGLASQHRSHLHPYASNRELKAIFHPDGITVCDFSPRTGNLSKRIQDLLPNNCRYCSSSSLIAWSSTAGEVGFQTAVATWEDALVRVSQKATRLQITEDCEVQSVAELLSSRPTEPPISIIDWRTEREAPEMIKPVVEQRLFHPNRIYVVVGLTRDFGQSLCRLFTEHGARHIVLASRHPNMSPRWKNELTLTYGANIMIEKLDVTDMADLLAFKARIAKSSPPVAGVVNGAMVLEDCVFSQMTLDKWNKVLRPKTVGSKNLDEVFRDADLDFFIMTSSFAAIGGHPGQANYATANMYMNGLAANRRRRGLVGSVLNIGVIHGLGLLQREKQDLYKGLSRDGYPPISERDIHHMFLEAIVAGRPGTSEPYDIITGLSRFEAGGENPLHWHTDPRFSHFTVDDKPNEMASDGQNKQSLHDQILDVGEPEAIAETILGPLSQRLEALLQLPKGAVSKHHNMADLGVDSLIAVELRNWLWGKLKQDVAMLKILSCSDIYRYIAEQIVTERATMQNASSSTIMQYANGSPSKIDIATRLATQAKPSGTVKVQ